jgi:PilZ domain-containing protein
MSMFWQERRFGDLYRQQESSNLKPDLRQSPRYEVNYLAQIEPDGVAPPLDCIICEISSGGAKLIVEQRNRMPNEFTLVFRRRCRIAHRTDGRIGVQFLP